MLLCVVWIFMKQTLIEKFMKIHIMLAAEKDVTYIVWKCDKSPKVIHSKFCTKVLYSFALNSFSGSSNQSSFQSYQSKLIWNVCLENMKELPKLYMQSTLLFYQIKSLNKNWGLSNFAFQSFKIFICMNPKQKDFF